MDKHDPNELPEKVGQEAAQAAPPKESLGAMLNRQRVRAADLLNSTVGQIGSLLFAGGATVVAAKDAIGRGFFNSMNKAGAFTDLQNVRDKAIGKVLEQAKHNEPVDVLGEIEKINHEYVDKMEARTRKFQVHGTLDKWRVLKPHQRMEVLMTTTAVGGVALGALVTIFTGREMAQKQQELQAQADKENNAARGR